jgi:AcrR family transcriptional regulator
VIYRQTENILRKLTARRQAILAAAFDVAAGQGLAAVQIVAIAEQAGIAAGTVYRYFPSKAELIAALADAFSRQELTVLQAAAREAPGPLSALAAAIMTFALRAIAHRRLFFALTAEPAEAEIDAARARFRGALVSELRSLIARAADAGGLADQDPALLAPALVGGLIDSLAGPLAVPPQDAAKARDQARQLTLFALRGFGVPDARARGLVVQADAQVEDSIGRLYSRMLCNQ